MRLPARAHRTQQQEQRRRQPTARGMVHLARQTAARTRSRTRRRRVTVKKYERPAAAANLGTASPSRLPMTVITSVVDRKSLEGSRARACRVPRERCVRGERWSCGQAAGYTTFLPTAFSIF